MIEEEAAKGLKDFFADGFRPISYIYTQDEMEGFWFHDATGPKKRLSPDDLDSLLYLLDVYINGE